MSIKNTAVSSVLGLMFFSLLVIYLNTSGSMLITFLSVLIMLVGLIMAQSSNWRDISILALGGDRRMLGNADLESSLTALSRTFDRARSMRAYTAVDEALAALERNASPKVVADWLVLQL